MILRFGALLTAVCAAALALAQQEGRGQERAAVGKLGQLTAEAPIYLKKDTRSRVLYKVKKDHYVVLRALDDKWATVVMRDGSDGFIEAKFVNLLPYNVSVQQPTTTRGGYVRGEGGKAYDWLVREATRYIGTPYVWGGNSLTSGVDCSGYVQQLYRMIGVDLPRTAHEQSFVGALVPTLQDLQPGDRIYFTDDDRQRVTHCGIYIGNGQFIHSSRGRGGVYVDQLTQKWIDLIVAIRR